MEGIMTIFPFLTFILVLILFLNYTHKETLVVENDNLYKENKGLKQILLSHHIDYENEMKDVQALPDRPAGGSSDSAATSTQNTLPA